MRSADHLTDDVLVRAIDDELSGSESAWAEAHLASCDRCTLRFQELRSMSLRIESAVAGFTPAFSDAEREPLVAALEAQQHRSEIARPKTLFHTWRWGMAVAAALLLGLLFAPQWVHRTGSRNIGGAQSSSSNAIEIDGETFVPLPYSNPDLPLSAHIVQMQVPVASLADAGVVFEPVSNQASGADRSVLADVLLGIDGRPVGIHVLSE